MRVDGPANANVAPPGWYMVFLVDNNGVPSVGKIVKVEKAADTVAPTAPGSLTATAQTGGNAQLAWSASQDAEGVTEYRVHRSTTASFTPSAANRVATVTSGTTYTDPGLATGTYYYRVIAADAAGNASQPSNQASVAINTDTTAPTVSVSAPAAGSVVRRDRVRHGQRVRQRGRDERAVPRGRRERGLRRHEQPVRALARHHDAHQRDPHAERRGA